MSIVVSDLSERLDTLTKLVLAEPVARIGHSRVTVRPLTLRGKAFFQLEYQQGQKVAHRNVARGALLETYPAPRSPRRLKPQRRARRAARNVRTGA